jgi:DNA polymerase-3 subunit delta'
VKFTDILDQETAVKALRSALEKDRVAHAYLFMGPSGVGRKLAARVFAQALNCENRCGHDPCGTCQICRLIASGKHPDVQTMVPMQRSSTISVKQIESILPSAYMRPHQGRCKVFIVSEADRLGLDAANKLLKTLEEPPPSTVFVLVTERPEGVLPTVASRCQPVKFGRLRSDSVAAILSKDFGIDKQRATVAAELSGGQVTRGLEFADPGRTEAMLGIFESFRDASTRMQAYDALVSFLAEQKTRLQEEAVEKISGLGEDLTSALKTSVDDRRKSFIDRQYRELLNDCLGFLLTLYRDTLVLKETGAEELVINRNKIDLLRSRARAMSHAAIVHNMEDIEDASVYCSHYVGEDRVFLDLLMRLRNA